ncbi:conserved oligomeric Golgi complex subunit 2 [Ceratobasidium sp. AG-Ba]|nr:conserved oligomeric Golgi complex subunit 2 [Ceratobasidium sp. AG-Ba]
MEDDLPYVPPLDATNPLLSAPGDSFDVDEFLLSRAHTSLPDLRTELNDYLGTLRSELVHLINENYADFISLRRLCLRLPLKSRAELRDIQDAVQSKLDARAALREDQAILRLLLKLADSVSRVEVLLAISISNDDPASPKNTSPQAATLSNADGLGLRGMDGLRLHVTEDDGESKIRAGYAKHLSRAAAELSQVLYLAGKARGHGCEFVDSLQFRIDRISQTLSRDLDHHLSLTLRALTDPSTLPSAASAERARLTAELVECFKIYDALRMWREAEDVVRRELVRPFIKKTIHPASLAAPQSPILPRTPFVDPPKTLSPNTPFTPFIPLATSTAASFSPATAHPEILIPEPEPTSTSEENAGSDALVGLYNKVLRFIQRDVMGVVRVAEGVSAKSRKAHGHGILGLGGTSPGGLGMSPGGLGMSPSGFGTSPSLLSSVVMAPSGSGQGMHTSANGTDAVDTEELERVEIIANVVWAELARALMDELGSVVFAVGRPDEFRQNYTTTQHLISALEALASQASVIALRAHPLTTTFSRRWQLPVYFQLRWKDIVGKCENILVGSTGERGEFITAEANAIFTAIQTCWSTQVFVPELGHRFWRLTLQLLSRYRTWINVNLPLKDTPAPPADRVNSLATGGIARPSTPDVSEQPHSDEASLVSLGGTLADVRLLQQKVHALWTNVIELLLPDSAPEIEEEEKPEDTLRRALSNLESFEKPISAQLIAILTRRCADPLSNARSIPAQYRGAKRTVTAPSPFIASVWRPLSTFFADNGPGARLKEDLALRWCEIIFEDVVSKYTTLLLKMKQAEQSLRRVKRVPTFSLFGGKSAADEERDEERIRAQMMRDVEALGDEARSLGLGLAEIVERSEGYKELKRVAAMGDAEPTTPA